MEGNDRGTPMLLCIGCIYVVQRERTVVLRSAEMQNFSAAECVKAIRGNLWNVPHLIFRKLPLDSFLHSAICIPQNTRAPPRQNSYSLDSKSSLTRYTTPHLTPLTLLATLDSSLMNILASLIKFRPSPMLAITISDSFVVSIITLIPAQLAPLPPPSFTPNSITVILSTTTYLSLRSPASNRSRTLLPVLLLKLLNAVTSLLSYTLHWLKITERIEYKLLTHL